MAEHYLALYRYEDAFPEDVVTLALACLQRHAPGFFVASMVVGRDASVDIPSPEAFSTDQVPAGFVVNDSPAWRIPIEGADGSRLVVYDDRAPDTQPASVVIEWPEACPPIEVLEALLGDLCKALAPDRALITDTDTLLRDDVYDRSFDVDLRRVPDALTWLTWLGPKLPEAQAAARAGLEDLATLRDVAGGLLIRLGERPTEDAPWWVERREAAEAAMKLGALHARFPRPPA